MLPRDLLSDRARRELKELRDTNHPRQMLSPEVELEIKAEAAPKAAARDEQRTMFDPDTQPRDHRRSDPDEPVTDSKGNIEDLQLDTDAVDSLTLSFQDPEDVAFDETTEPDEAASPDTEDLMSDTEAVEELLDLGTDLDLMTDTNPIEEDLNIG